MIDKEIVSKVPSQSANYVAHPSDSTKSDIDINIKKILDDAEEYNNTKLTKSVIVYNCLMQHGQITYSDGLTEIETRLDERLEKENICVSEVNNVKNEYEDVNLYADENKRMQVTLPVTVFESVNFSRGWNNKIEEAVEHCVKSVYQNRKHRITVKQDILSVIHKNMDVEDLDDVAIKVYNEVVDNSIFDRFDYFGFDELEEHKDKFESKDEKKEALYEVYQNLYRNTRVPMQNKFLKIFEYSNKYHGMEIYNNFCKEYKVHEYNNFDEYEYVDIDIIRTIVDNTKSHDEIDFVIHRIMNKFCESLDENESVDEFGQILKNNQIIDDISYETFTEYINEIEEEYGDIENLRSVKYGTIRPIKD